MKLATTIEMTVWACPTPGCGNHYASSSSRGLDLTATPNLESDLSHDATTDPYRSKVTGNRGECPDCKARGKRVQRVPVAVTVPVPSDAPVAPEGARAGDLNPAA